MTFTKDRPYFWLFVLLAVGGFVADQASKYGIFWQLYPDDAHLQEPPHIVLIPDAFRLEAIHTWERDPGDQPLSFLRTISGERLPHVNRGALFGIGNADRANGGANPIFAGVSLIAAGFILVWAGRVHVAQDRTLSVALGLILGGTLGNLYDRLVFGGVRDFLHWYGGFDWPVFNIADCGLVCGAFLLLLHSLFVHDSEAAPAPATGTPAAADNPMATAITVLDSTTQK